MTGQGRGKACIIPWTTGPHMSSSWAPLFPFRHSRKSSSQAKDRLGSPHLKPPSPQPHLREGGFNPPPPNYPSALVEILSSQEGVYENVASGTIRRPSGGSSLFGYLGGIFPVERFGISSFIFFPLRFLAN